MRKAMLKGILIFSFILLAVSVNYAAVAAIVSATASTTYGANTAALSCDGNTGSRWESAQGVDPQWIYWDLGSSQPLSTIIIDWEAAAASNYTVQGSTDAATWTTLATVLNSKYMVNHTIITNSISGTYRYVRMYGTTRTTIYGYSIWEVTINTVSGTSSTPVSSSSSSVAVSSSKSSTPSSSGTGGITAIVAAVASTTYGANTAALSCDGSTGTRWESAQGVDPQWIYWDLGSSQTLLKIVIDWEVASASAYQIQGSADASAWTTIATVANSSQVDHNQITTTLSGTFRYVRMYGTARTTVWGYSIWETSIYTTSGTGSSSPAVSSSSTAPVSSSGTASSISGSTIMVQAENWSSMFSVATEPTLDVGGGLDVGWIVTGSWMEYSVNITSAGGYIFSLRYTSPNDGAKADLRVNGTTVTTLALNNTGGWQSWATAMSNVTLPAGTLTIRIYANVGGFDVNWFSFTPGTLAPAPTPPPALTGGNEAAITALINQMTQAEKIQQVGDDTGDAFKTSANTRLGIPGFMMADGSRGTRGGTLWPAWVGTACTFNTNLVYLYGIALGQEFRALGNNVGLAPMMNVIRDGRFGRAWESMSEDPYIMGELAVNFVKGMQSVGCAATVKHMACYNECTAQPAVVISERALQELYLYHFRTVVQKANPYFIMAAYGGINGYANTAYYHMLTEVCKWTWPYWGAIMSDWGAVYNQAQAANGGTDLEMPGPFAGLDTNIAAGTVQQSRLDDMVRRVLRVKYNLGMMTPGYNPTNYTSSLNSATNITLEQTMANESIVLARNTGLLPLSKTATQKIAVLGTWAKIARTDGGGSAGMGATGYFPTPFDSITNKVKTSMPNVTITEDYNNCDTAIVFVGINDPGEGFDRTNTDLLSNQNEYVAQVLAAKPNNTIVVYTGGSACVSNTWASAPSVLIALYPGLRQGPAIADILFGDVNPSGKLSVSFPANVSQLPAFPTNVYETAGEGRGYFYYDKHNLTPLYAFGHGLSYTTFQYSNLRISPANITKTGTVTVQVDVKNAGSRAGQEVVQLYIQPLNSSVDRRVKDLRGFSKVNLAAGATTTVTFTVDAGAVSYFDDSITVMNWVAEPLTYNVLIGSSSRDIRLTGSFILN